MSNHKTPLTELEREGMIAHGLESAIGNPSQLADTFRAGIAWVLNQQPKKDSPMFDFDKLRAIARTCGARLANPEGYLIFSPASLRDLLRAYGLATATSETGIAEDGPCQEADGCPTETAVLRRFWRGQSIEPRHYPEWYKALQSQPKGTFARGDLVRKVSGSMWSGVVVGEYSTELTPEGYAVESLTERGSVQIYPAKALERMHATAIPK